jgi:galacturonosyltransferase
MTILILANNDEGLYKFRRELLEKLAQEHEVFFSVPYGEYVEKMINDRCHYIETKIDRRSANPFTDAALLLNYIKMIRRVNPDLVLTYTIKPNIYGGLASRINRKKVIHTVTGLGSVYIMDLPIKPLVVMLNKIAFKNAARVFFMNKDNKAFYIEKGIVSRSTKTELVNGSGVNTNVFLHTTLPDTTDIFLMVARLIKDKGVIEYIDAARILKQKYENVEFQLIGVYEDEDEDMKNLVDNANEEKIIQFLGGQADVKPFYQKCTCVVLPSYGEGCGTVLQEGAASGRPLITCDTFGCRDNVADGVNGFLCKVADKESLASAMEKYINLSKEEKRLMSESSRKMAEEIFSRDRVIEKYIKVINDLC